MDAYTPTEYAILTARHVTVGYGADLLNEQDQVIDDLSPDLVGGVVERNNYASVHGTCDLELLRALPWTTVRVRPWQEVQAAAGTVRRNLGVYVLTTPDVALSDDDTTVYEVQGYDKLHLLQHEVGDTYVVAAGTGYLDAARQAIVDAGVTGLPALFDGTASASVLADPFVWVLDTSEPVTWLRVVNDLLAAIGYRGLWVDHDGRFRSEPYQSPAVRPPEWTFDLADPRTNIVAPARTLTVDEFERINYWRFVRDGMTTQPTEGNGLYTVDRSEGAPRRPRVVQVQAADQSALQSIGDAEVDAASRRTRLLDAACGPLPILGHFDVSTWIDPELGPLKVLTRSHVIPLDGAEDTALTLEVL